MRKPVAAQVDRGLMRVGRRSVMNSAIAPAVAGAQLPVGLPGGHLGMEGSQHLVSSAAPFPAEQQDVFMGAQGAAARIQKAGGAGLPPNQFVAKGRAVADDQVGRERLLAEQDQVCRRGLQG